MNTESTGIGITLAAKPNVDLAEIAKFSALANRWWDPNGPQDPLHEIGRAHV